MEKKEYMHRTLTLQNILLKCGCFLQAGFGDIGDLNEHCRFEIQWIRKSIVLLFCDHLLSPVLLKSTVIRRAMFSSQIFFSSATNYGIIYWSRKCRYLLRDYR